MRANGRTSRAKAKARERGTPFGRKPLLIAEAIQQLRKPRKTGKTVPEIMRQCTRARQACIARLERATLLGRIRASTSQVADELVETVHVAAARSRHSEGKTAKVRPTRHAIGAIRLSPSLCKKQGRRPRRGDSGLLPFLWGNCDGGEDPSHRRAYRFCLPRD